MSYTNSLQSQDGEGGSSCLPQDQSGSVRISQDQSGRLCADSGLGCVSGCVATGEDDEVKETYR